MPDLASPVRAGDVRIVFDNKLWGGRDVGDNRQFFKPAEILRVYLTEKSAWGPGGEEVATVRFLHDGRVSNGHFTQFMRLGRSGVDAVEAVNKAVDGAMNGGANQHGR